MGVSTSVAADTFPGLAPRATRAPLGAAVRRALARLARVAPADRVALVAPPAIALPPAAAAGTLVIRRAPHRADDVVALAAAGAIDRVILSLAPGAAAPEPLLLAGLSAVDVAIDLLDRDGRLRPLRRLAIGRGARALKGASDRVGAALLLVALLPALALIALAVRLGDGGPVLFRQPRHGRHGASFDILKFRTMRVERDPDVGPVVQTALGDARVTPVGRVLRATSLDELPQLVNVLRGEMSLVGPRPHPRLMLTEQRFSDDIAPDYAQRHRVRPGMTGWAQVNGSRGGIASAEALRRRVRLDLDYIERWSPLLDLRIVLMTPLRLVFHHGRAF